MKESLLLPAVSLYLTLTTPTAAQSTSTATPGMATDVSGATNTRARTLPGKNQSFSSHPFFRYLKFTKEDTHHEPHFSPVSHLAHHHDGGQSAGLRAEQLNFITLRRRS